MKVKRIRLVNKFSMESLQRVSQMKGQYLDWELKTYTCRHLFLSMGKIDYPCSTRWIVDLPLHTSSKPIVPLQIISNTASFRKQYASRTPYQIVWSYQVSLWISSKLWSRVTNSNFLSIMYSVYMLLFYQFGIFNLNV